MPVAVNGKTSKPERSDAVEVIVLTHSSAPVPTRLMQALQRRASAVRLVTDAPAVMVELALTGRSVLIVNQAHRFASLDRLLAAVAHYFPDTDCWQFQEQVGESRGRPQLTRLTRDAEGASLDAEDEAADASGVKRDGGSPDQADADEHDTEPLLTAEELAMLLGDPDTPPRDVASR